MIAELDSSQAKPDTIDTLIETIAHTLPAHPQGLSEYELIQLLKSQGHFGFLDPPPADPLALFCAHFLIFHVLYRLRDRLLNSQTADIEIHTLKIRLLPYGKTQTALSTPDNMRAYYLDLNHLETTTSRDVNELIASFWTRLRNQNQRKEALKELGLEDPVDDKTITRTYRRMAMKHHPDRGGNKTRLQALNSAVKVLTRKTNSG